MALLLPVNPLPLSTGYRIEEYFMTQAIEHVDTTSAGCTGGHCWFVFSPSSSPTIPEGLLCVCGQAQYSRRQAILDEIEVLNEELGAIS